MAAMELRDLRVSIIVCQTEAQQSGFGLERRSKRAGGRRFLLRRNKKTPEQSGLCSDVVGVGRFELPASWTRTMRATNCATPRNILLSFSRWDNLLNSRQRDTRYYWLRQHARSSKPGFAVRELLAQLRYTPKYFTVFFSLRQFAEQPPARHALLLASPARKMF